MSKKSLIISLAVFLVLSLATTVALIYVFYNNNASSNIISNNNFLNGDSENKSDNIKKIDYSLGIKDINAQYTMNNIETEQLKYTEGKAFKKYTWSSYYEYPIEISYFKISGLKDKKIEEKINEKIKDLAFKTLPSGEAMQKEVIVSSYGNFSNILSIHASYSMEVEKKPGDANYDYDSDYNYNYYYGSAGLTLDLTTGNEIALKDVFVDNYNFKPLITNTLYNSLAWDYEYLDWDYDIETDSYIPPENSDRRDLEDKLFELMYQFDKGNYSFCVESSALYISIPDLDDTYGSTRGAYISLEDYYDKVAIFNRFRTSESIFENGESDDKRYFYISEYTLGNMHELNNNLFIYYNEDYSYEEPYKNQYVEWLNGRINAEKVYAAQNPDKQIIEFISNGYDYIDDYPDYSTGYTIKIMRAELPKDSYDKNDGKNNLINIIRHPTEDEDYYFGDSYIEDYMAEDMITFLKDIESSENLDIYQWKNGVYYRYSDYYDQRFLDYDTFFILKSDEELLSEDDLINLDLESLNLAYNEIFARYGHDFANKNLRSYFYGQLWYAMIPGKKVSVEELSDIEKANLDLISKRIEYLKSNQGE